MFGISISLGWSIGTGTPLIIIGYYLLGAEVSTLSYTGYPVLISGFAIIVIGIYVEILSPPNVTKIDHEKLVFSTQPMLRVPLLRSAIGVLLGICGIIGIFSTNIPLFYPIFVFLVGVALYATGLVQIWRNNLTRYYVTTKRVIEAYQFLGVTRRTMPRDYIQGIEENKSFLERLLRIGHVRVESAGDTNVSRITARFISQPTKFAKAIRNRSSVEAHTQGCDPP